MSNKNKDFYKPTAYIGFLSITLCMILGFSDTVHPPLVHRFIKVVILTWIGLSSMGLLKATHQNSIR